MTRSIHKIISKNAGQNAKKAVEAMSATEFQRREKISLKERTFIAGFMELEFSLPCTSIKKQVIPDKKDTVMGAKSHRLNHT